MSEKVIRQKKIIGIVAIALLVVLIVLGLLRYLTTIEWTVAALIVAGIANLMFRKTGKSQPN
ncbi:MAG: hypothetical protein LBI79_02035 [Nitrososphaerota archaeon]|jgi:multidrug resistance efflux pump|nr:hypothetical protein [Nitrososphaerota archaeon]